MHNKIIEIENEINPKIAMYDIGFLKTSKNFKNLNVLSFSAKSSININKYKNIPQNAKGTPKNCDSEVWAIPSQSINSFTEQKLDNAYGLKFAL